MKPGRWSRRDVLRAAAVAPVAPRGIAAIEHGDGVPAWLRGVTRMGFLTPGEVDRAADMGVQVVHTNVVWPYYPLRRDGGGLAAKDDAALRELADRCRARGVRLVLGLPPFPPVALVRAHPDWRVDPDGSGAAAQVEPLEDNLGTRLGCNVGPWGDYLIDVCAELTADHGLDGFSFDGDYHAPLCRCGACAAAYRADTDEELPAQANLDEIVYREYLAWRGGRLADHYRRLRAAIRAANPDAALVSWTVNAGRYGHFLHSPRAMPIEVNRVFDAPMQEWWHDETNQGASVVPLFGATYLKAAAGDDRPATAEPYLMSRGNPYGTDSFPAVERRWRALAAVACGNVLALSLGWAGHDVAGEFDAIRAIDAYLPGRVPVKWLGLHMSEATRQFVAYRDIAARFLPHPLGLFRAASEAHLPCALLTDMDLTPGALAPYAVLALPGSVALSDAQCAAIRGFVEGGGGLVATGEVGLCDELGRRRRASPLADLLGVTIHGPVEPPGGPRPALDENFARALDESYWKDRVGMARLRWEDHALVRDPRLSALVPSREVAFRGPLLRVSEPADPSTVAIRMRPDGTTESWPAAILRRHGAGRVVYLPAALDAALWSYAYPYQRVLLERAIRWAAGDVAPPVEVAAPMCVHATCFDQPAPGGGSRRLVHLVNGIDTAAHHGQPGTDVPLREEVVPIGGIRLTFRGPVRSVRVEPGGAALEPLRVGDSVSASLPALEQHLLVVVEVD